MEQKKEETPALVGSKINVSINQNDLVDLLIEEKLEDYENKIALLNKEYESNLENFKKIRDLFKQEAIEKVKNSREYVNIEKFLKNIPHNIITRVDVKYAVQEEAPAIGMTVFRGKFDETAGNFILRNFKNSIEYGNNSFVFSSKNVKLLYVITFQFEFVESIISLATTIAASNLISFESNTKMLQEIALNAANNTEVYNKLVEEYLTFRSSSKRLRAKIIKLTLQQSTEGLSVLELLKSVENTKLIKI